MNFVPLPVGLGTDAYELVHDIYGTGPLAFRTRPGAFSWPVTAAIVVVESLSGLTALPPPGILIRHRGRLPHLYDAERGGARLQYGYFKLFAVLAPPGLRPVAMGIAGLGGRSRMSRRWSRARRPHGRRLAASCCARYACSSFTTAMSRCSTPPGDGVSPCPGARHGPSPDGRAGGTRRKAVRGGQVQLHSPHGAGSVAADAPLRLKEAGGRGSCLARRARAIAMSELPHADAYGWFDTQQVWRNYHRLRDAEDYDYYLLGPDNDPRLEGLGGEDLVWTDGVMSLYRSGGTVRRDAVGHLEGEGQLGYLAGISTNLSGLHPGTWLPRLRRRKPAARRNWEGCGWAYSV